MLNTFRRLKNRLTPTHPSGLTDLLILFPSTKEQTLSSKKFEIRAGLTWVEHFVIESTKIDLHASQFLDTESKYIIEESN